MMLPAVGFSSATIIRPIVVLPQPDSPTRPKVSPARISMLTSVTALTEPVRRCSTPAVTGNSLNTPASWSSGPTVIAGMGHRGGLANGGGCPADSVAAPGRCARRLGGIGRLGGLGVLLTSGVCAVSDWASLSIAATSAALVCVGWKQANSCVRSDPSSCGSLSRQSACAYRHRGANRQPVSVPVSSGGRPGIEYSRCRAS